MKRRNFIIIGAAGIAAASIPSAFYIFRDIEYDPALALPQSLSMIWDNEMIMSAGSSYRLETPVEDSERQLVKRLLAGLPDNKDPIISNFEEQIKEDFDNGNIVIIDGWILSVTEARQCALFSLTEPK
jgi:hypothetical protein